MLKGGTVKKPVVGYKGRTANKPGGSGSGPWQSGYMTAPHQKRGADPCEVI